MHPRSDLVLGKGKEEGQEEEEFFIGGLLTKNDLDDVFIDNKAEVQVVSELIDCLLT